MHCSTRIHLATLLKADNPHSVGATHALDLSVRRRDSLDHLQPPESPLSAFSLVRNHATDRAPEDHARSTEMERTTGGVDVAALAQEGQVLQLVPIKDVVSSRSMSDTVW